MTRSTFSGFTIAQLGMNASQRALEVTGQNISNINTAGYTRQQVDLVSLNLKGSNAYSTSPDSKIGYGVEITGISQIRDPFLDVQYRNQIAKVGTADAHQGTLDQLADIFDETSSDALKTALSNLESSLKSMSPKANDSEFDSIVRSRFQVILNYIHQKSDELSSVRQDAVDSLEKTDIPKVNSLLSDVGELNDSIWKSQLQGNPALELQDQRNSKLDELASYLPISVTYKDVNISNGAKFEYPVVKFTGSDGMTYNLTAGEHGENVASLSVEFENGSASINLIPASDYPSYADVSVLKTPITDYLKEGSIKGSVDMLNKSGELDNPPTDYRGIGYYEKAFDSFVQTFAETFNKLNTNTVPYTGASSLPASGTAGKMTDGRGNAHAQYTLNLSNITGNFLKGENIIVNGNIYTFGDGTPGTVKTGTDLKESLENLAKALNGENNNPAGNSLKVNGSSVSGQWTYSEGTGRLTWTGDGTLAAGDTVSSIDFSLEYSANKTNIKNYDLFKTSDNSSVFTAGNIKISDDWMNKNIHIIASQEENPGSTANDNISRMISALSEERSFKYQYTYTDSSGNPQTGKIEFYKGSFAQCYCNLENTQGIDSSANNAILQNHISVLQETANNRDSVSGVSLDEEGINLLQYQRSYTAAARLMTTLDEALDVLINNTGVVGR